MNTSKLVNDTRVTGIRLLFICGGGDYPSTSPTYAMLKTVMKIYYPDINVVSEHCSWPSFRSMTVTASMQHLYDTYFSSSSAVVPTILMCHSLGFKVGYALIYRHPELVTSGFVRRVVALNGSITWTKCTKAEFGDDVFERWKQDGHIVLPSGDEQKDRDDPHVREYCQWSDMVENGYSDDQPIITNVPVTFITGTHDAYIPSYVAENYIQTLRQAGNPDATVVSIPDDHFVMTRDAWQAIMKTAESERWFR